MTSYTVVQLERMKPPYWRNNETGELLESVHGLPAPSQVNVGQTMTPAAHRAPMEGQNIKPPETWETGRKPASNFKND